MAIDSSLARDGSRRGLARIVDARSCREGTKWPSEATQKNSTQLLAVCAMPGQLDHFTALVFQQYGEQPTLCKGQC